MPDILAIYGSPRRQGNTALLLDQAVEGARAQGARVHSLVLRDLKISPCLEIYACKQDGRCAIRDDFQAVRQLLLNTPGLMLASPIFFYAVSAQVKALMDRCQSLWVQKYWIDKQPFGGGGPKRGKALFIAAGATQGKRLFEGALLSVKYLLDVLDLEPWQNLLCRGLDFEGDVLAHPEYLEQARLAGAGLAQALGFAGRPA